MAYQSPSAAFLFQSHHDHHNHNDHFHGGGGEDEVSDDGEKKRLKLEQVKSLEKSFEVGNKLEPERKLQLAKALGLHPRQVAIWFQNRRARWKTKQLERDYHVLKNQFDAAKTDNHTLQAQNNKLHAQLVQLKSDERGFYKKERDEGSWSNGSDNSCDHLKLDISTTMTKHLFNSSLIRPTTGMDQDDTLCNIFGTIEDQPGMWTWPQHHHFH